MTDTLVILYAPDSPKDREQRLVHKLTAFIKGLNIEKVKINIRSDLPITEFQNQSENLITLIIGWGLPVPPSWELILPDRQLMGSIRQFIAFDLFERKGFDAKHLKEPRMNAGAYLSQNIKRHNRNLFFDGFFLQAKIPYGLKKVPVQDTLNDSVTPTPLFTFAPGDPSEVEIVRMIFELFVSHGYNRTEICSLLNAQEVRAPQKNGAWNAGNIKTILESPFYIGANQYRGFIKHDVFPAIIQKYIFYEAQARIAQMDFSMGKTTRKKAIP